MRLFITFCLHCYHHLPAFLLYKKVYSVRSKAHILTHFSTVFIKDRKEKMSDLPSNADAIADAKISPGDDYEEIREQVRSKINK
jgi:hypothetical protein